MFEDSESRLFSIEQHQRTGRKLKRMAYELEQIKAELIYSYPKSSKREAKQLEIMIEKIKSTQTNLHSRLITEFGSNHNDDELLPIYLGRYTPPNYS